MSTRKHIIQILANLPHFEKVLQKVILFLLIALYFVPLLLAMLTAWVLQGEVIFLRNLAAVVAAYLLTVVVIRVAVAIKKNLAWSLFLLRLVPLGLVAVLALPLSLPIAFLLAGIPGIVGALATLIPYMVMFWIKQRLAHNGKDKQINSSLRSPRSTLATPLHQPPSPEDINRASQLASQGVEAFKMRSYNEALHYFDEALKLNPRDAGTLNDKGYTLYVLQRPEEALVCLEMAIDANPCNRMAWQNKYAITLSMARIGDISRISESTQILQEACQALSISQKEFLAKWENGQE